MKTLQTMFFFASFTLSAEPCKQMSPEVLQALEEVVDEIYDLNTQDIQELVCQDFGCIPEISAEELQQKKIDNPDILVLNVLSDYWYHDCHITGSINVPLKELIYTVQDWNRSQEIVVYCALDKCDAGEKAYVLLRCMGFSSVVDYSGGMKEWFQLGYPVEGPCVGWYLHEKQSRIFDFLPTEFDFKQTIKQTGCIEMILMND